MNESQDDILRTIHETEYKADQIVRKAKVQAQSMREQARAKVEEILKAKERERAEERRIKIEREREAIEREAQALLAQARERAERMIEQRRPEMDRVVARLLERLLPPGMAKRHDR